MISRIFYTLLSLLLASSILTAQRAGRGACDSVPYTPDPLSILLSGAIYAGYPLNRLDQSIHETRDALLGDEWRNHYDDLLQFAPYALQLTMRSAHAEGGRSRNWSEMITADLIGGAGVATVVLSVKDLTHRMRPDGSTANSFPSGHTATAFLGAELFNLEYGYRYPLLAQAQYAVATAVALGRISNNRHWYSDLLWGGVVGISMARVGYLVSDLIFDRYHQPPHRNKLSDDLQEGLYIYISNSYLISLDTQSMLTGISIAYQTAHLGYALEIAGEPSALNPQAYCDLIVSAPIENLWQYAQLRQMYGIGLSYGGFAQYRRSYAHLQAGVELSPRIQYLDHLSLSLRVHCEPYRSSYLTLGMSLRHHWL